MRLTGLTLTSRPWLCPKRDQIKQCINIFCREGEDKCNSSVIGSPANKQDTQSPFSVTIGSRGQMEFNLMGSFLKEGINSNCSSLNKQEPFMSHRPKCNHSEPETLSEGSSLGPEFPHVQRIRGSCSVFTPPGLTDHEQTGPGSVRS